jgi:dihydrolipoamide dehydrogenase
MQKKRDLIIIGGGPGGYVAAIRAAQLKKSVLLIEEDRIGGTCMNYGCIPTKYLLHQTKMLTELKENKNLDGPREEIRCNWKIVQEEKTKIVERLVRGVEFILRRNGIEMVRGQAFLKGERQVSVEIQGSVRNFEADTIVLATGSQPSELPFLKPNGQEIITSREALELENIPKKLIVVGAGAVGIELGTIYRRLGTEVTILEIMPTILPGSDREIVARLERILLKQGLKIYTQMKIEESQVREGKVTLKGTCLKTQSSFEFEGEKVLLSAGRKPNLKFLKVENLPFSLDKGGFVKVNSRLETCIPGVFAIGDLIGGKLLAHKASHEGMVAAENAAGSNREMDYQAVPLAVFTEPEFASVGLTEQEAKDRELKIQVGRFPLQACARALTIESMEGMVKIIANDSDEILGAHILAPNASEIIPELTLALNKKMKLQDISSSIHIHPTVSESVMEAALKAKNMAIHVLNI